MIHFLCLGLNNLLENLRFGSNNLLDYILRGRPDQESTESEPWRTAALPYPRRPWGDH